LRPDEVLTEAAWLGGPPNLDALQQALNQLVEWGNLQSQPDTARVATIEDFYRKRLLYRLTVGGEENTGYIQRRYCVSAEALSGINEGKEMSRKRFTSVWDAIEDSAAEAASMKLRAELASEIIEKMQEPKLTQAKAADLFDVTQPRVSDLRRGRLDYVSRASPQGAVISLNEWMPPPQSGHKPRR
jgi:predicted XRE-type DNA-binding protein